MPQPIASRSDRVWFEVIQTEFPSDGCAAGLFERFLVCPGYSREFVADLIAVGRGEQGDSWEVRRLAALILQEHLLGLDAESTTEFDFVFQQLRLKDCRTGKLPKSVWKEGYSTRKLRGFSREFRRRLKRPRAAVRPRESRDVSTHAVRSFAVQSRQECKLALGRYLFSPDEVVERICAQVKVVTGMGVALDDKLVRQEAERAVSDLPDYESAILRKLQAGVRVFWVADHTSSELNSLVEYPLGTVVLVVKPPGSHYEIELKRAGRRGEHPLGAVLKRGGRPVPPSHRLDGGSMASALFWEAEKSATFSNVYRQVHDRRAPVTQIVHCVSKFKVPHADGELPTVNYLTDSGIYGNGYERMREEMAGVVAAFRRDRGEQVTQIPGDIGLTVQFVAFAAPAQAVICGSSSFRLDLVARYLSADGPAAYFTRGPVTEFDDGDAQRLADNVLDEALGVYRPPQVEYKDHRQYVEAALTVPKNRLRADATYLDLVPQIGKVWGTLLAMRGYSFGESFVARNVGLRSAWRRGRWRVRLVFHDHDNLVVPPSNQREFHPRAALRPMRMDDRFIDATPDGEGLERELNCLQRIYGVSEAVRKKGRKRMHKSLKRAYVKTQDAMTSNREVRSRFHEDFVATLRDWDAAARTYLAYNGSGNNKAWKSRVKKSLKKKGYPKRLIKNHCDALEEHGDFVSKYAFLFRAKGNK